MYQPSSHDRASSGSDLVSSDFMAHRLSRVRSTCREVCTPYGMIAWTRPGQGGSTPMQMRLELIPLPVSDVDRAVAFYADKLGFKKDFDVQPSDGVRVVQLTPAGSGCSVGFGTGLD